MQRIWELCLRMLHLPLPVFFCLRLSPSVARLIIHLRRSKPDWQSYRRPAIADKTRKPYSCSGWTMPKTYNSYGIEQWRFIGHFDNAAVWFRPPPPPHFTRKSQSFEFLAHCAAINCRFVASKCTKQNKRLFEYEALVFWWMK